MTENDLIWLAGFLEGEGCFLEGPPSGPNLPRVAAVTVDLDVIERVSGLLGVGFWPTKKAQPHHKQAYSCCVKGQPALLLMFSLRPFMGKRRTAQIDKIIASFEIRDKRRTNLSDVQIYDIWQAAKVSKYRVVAEQFGVPIDTVKTVMRRWGGGKR